MRWSWVDKFENIEPNVRAVAVKNVSLAEDHLHDHVVGFPVMPASLMIEGMAQTAGVLVGLARQFKEKVILAKINRATFTRLVRPGEQIVYEATISNMNETGAGIEGRVSVRTRVGIPPIEVATIEMMFSHIDNNMAGLRFPEFNFVFNPEFMHLYETYTRDFPILIP